jgi:hypothetical protein
MLPVRFTGEHVSASEAERIAVALPDVEDCAMSGVASKLGEQDIRPLPRTSRRKLRCTKGSIGCDDN